MRKVVVFALAAVLASHVVWAQSKASPVEQELIKIEQAGLDFTIKKDKAGMERLYSDDYIYTHSNGSVANKAQDVAEVVSGAVQWTSGTVTDTQVRVFGDVGLMLGVSTLQGSAKGYVAGARRFTDVFVRRGGRWQQAGGISTIVAAGGTAATSNTTALSSVRQLTAKAMAAASADEKAVAAAEQAFVQADLKNDTAKARALQTKDFTFVSRSGAVASPSDPPGTPLKSLVTSYDHAQSLGSAIVIHGSLLWIDTQNFTPGVLRFMRVWVKEGTEWKLAAEQRTPIAAATR